MNAKHTKGPWEAHNGEVTTRQVDGRSYRRIACVQDYGLGCSPEVEANARLIAAAPELLSCLLAYVELEEQAAPYSSSPMRERARSAIAKATGESVPA